MSRDWLKKQAENYHENNNKYQKITGKRLKCNGHYDKMIKSQIVKLMILW